MEEFKNNSTEAPASATYSLTSKGGFSVLFTIRKNSGKDLLDALELLEPSLVEKGYKPQEKRSFGGGSKTIEYVPERKCPLCSNQLVYQTLKDGRKMIKCSTSKYDFATKTSSGCKFIEWPEQKNLVQDVIRDY
jgi:hypothetical protein